MLRSSRVRYIIIGILILLWWRQRNKKTEPGKPERSEPFEIEMPPEESISVQLPSAHQIMVDEYPIKTPETLTPLSESDNLQRIEGIGPKIATILKESGVRSYTQLAAMDVEEIRVILNEAKIRMAQPDTWPDQAGLAAEGKWDDLATLQSKLKGGRRV